LYNKLLTISEAAKILGVSPSTLRRMERDGVVEGYGLKVIYTPGGQRRYMLDEIQHLFSQQGFSGQIGFGRRPALLIRDLTKAFTDANSRLSIELTGQIDATAALVKTAQRLGIPVIFSRTVFDPDHYFSQLWGKKFSSLQALLENSEWVQIHPDLQGFTYDLVNSTVFITDFYQSPVHDFLKARGIDTVILAGATTSGSIRATTIDAMQRGYHVVIPEEAVGDRNQALQNNTLLDLNARYADVLSLDQTLKNMEGAVHDASGAK